MSEPTATALRTHPLIPASAPPELADLIADRIRTFRGWRMDGTGDGAGAGDGTGQTGGQSGGTGTGETAGQTGSGSGQQTGQSGESKPDLSKLSVDDLRGHTGFQTEINRVVGERVKKEQEKWQQKLEDEKKRAGLDDAGKVAAEKEAAEKRATESDAAVKTAHQLVAATKAEVLAIAAGARPDRTAAIVREADLTGAVDDDGVVNEAVVKAAVVKVLGDYPEWKADTKGTGSAASRSGGELNGGAGEGKTYTKSQVEAMTTEEVAAQMPDIEKAIAEGRFVYDK